MIRNVYSDIIIILEKKVKISITPSLAFEVTIHDSEIKKVNGLLKSLESIQSCLGNQLTESIDDLRVILENFSQTIQEINIKNLKKNEENIKTPEFSDYQPVKLEKVKTEALQKIYLSYKKFVNFFKSQRKSLYNVILEF